MKRIDRSILDVYDRVLVRLSEPSEGRSVKDRRITKKALAKANGTKEEGIGNLIGQVEGNNYSGE